MSVFEAPEFDGHEQVSFFNDEETGLRAIIAIHSTTLGPALGGCRMWPYEDERAAIRDVLRLARGMTYKAAVLDCGLGGGKSVIIGDSRTHKTPELLRAMGRAIAACNEQYIVGEDVGTNPDDMRVMREVTRHVSCLRKEDGGYGDPAPMTALGVFSAIRAGVEEAFGSDDLDDIHVAVQGVGNVGFNLCRLLDEAGATLTVCDVYPEQLERVTDEIDVSVVEPGEIYDVPAEVFAPCALGGVVNDGTIDRLNVRVVAGAANNQLDHDRHGIRLAEREIVYLPDYVANGGGLISCAAEWYGHDASTVPISVRGIFDTCRTILKVAREDGVTTSVAADRIAERRFRPN
ncbi:MAG: Glu/Leu/Phe/Val dehydrogenase dimerization domain-containing protein [Xanthomonadales bacterium]|nr:Glu/Leu/Phe/Val dehydrogenase dimerization domain-containing protein [Xanthomonadales bacterium]